MKKFNQIMVMVCVLFILCLVGSNIYIKRVDKVTGDKGYKVSLNRIEYAIEAYEEQMQTFPSSLEELQVFAGGEKYPGITGLVSLCPAQHTAEEIENFLEGEAGMYAIITTDQAYYRVAYEVIYEFAERIGLMVIIMICVVFALVLAILLFVRRHILCPFTRISTIPYELSKGNLTIPLEENRNRFFGRFLWGMDLLRENLEEKKMHELALQRDKKLLLLSLSHDIKTPLSAIKLYAMALLRNLYSEEKKKKEIIRNINTKADEIEEYISKIVKASNEDFLHFDVNNREYYVKDVMEQIQSYYGDKMELNHIDFEIGSYPNCMVYGDPDRMVEVVQNIIENAIKYGDGREIRMAMERDEEAYMITISNSGCMLEMKELPHIFDSFYRGSNVEEKAGSGLGLYICRELLHQMEGEITASIKDYEHKESTNRKMCMQIILRLA